MEQIHTHPNNCLAPLVCPFHLHFYGNFLLAREPEGKALQILASPSVLSQAFFSFTKFMVPGHLRPFCFHMCTVAAAHAWSHSTWVLRLSEGGMAEESACMWMQIQISHRETFLWMLPTLLVKTVPDTGLKQFGKAGCWRAPEIHQSQPPSTGL